MPRMIGRARAASELGARLEPALKTGWAEGEGENEGIVEAVGAGCGIRGFE
jgi:hypothetical protein